MSQEVANLNLHAFRAVLRHDEEALRDALGRGADPKFCLIPWISYCLIPLSRNPYSEYMLTSARGLVGCCRLLLARGADPNRAAAGYESPIHTACGWGEGPEGYACVRLLLDAGAEVDLCDEDGDTALHIACGSGFEPIVKLLIQRGANLKAKNDDGLTPLEVAVGNNRRNTALTLLRAGAVPKVLESQDVSPANRELNDYMVGIVNERTPAPSYLGGWAARARKHEDACLRVVSRCAPLPRDVMLAIVSYWSLPH